MRSATWNEIEYLATNGGIAAEDARLVREMWERLDAVRCFDQNFSPADWRPHRGISSWPLEPIRKTRD
jgi:hypothetical protein